MPVRQFSTPGGPTTRRLPGLRIAKAICLVSLVVIAAIPATSQADPFHETELHEHLQGEVLVGLRPGVPGWAGRGVATAVGGSILSSNDDINVIRLKVPVKKLDSVIRALERNPNVEFAEPNFIASAADEPSDPFFDYQWDLVRIQASEAWIVTTGSAAIRVAILDTGIEANHPDLSGKVVAEKNLSNSPTVTDLSGHGTHVAGIVGAITNNGEGVASLGYGVSLMNVKVLNDSGSGSYGDLADGITWSAKNGARVINMSLGGAATSKTLERAVNWAARSGAILIAAAGNGGSTTPYYPAAYSKVIAVASTDFSDQLSPYSNRGEWVAVAAPGGPIWSTVTEGSYGYKAGTSMAAPHVSALAALVLTRFSDPKKAVECVLNEADDVGLEIGGGRINALRAVECQ